MGVLGPALIRAGSEVVTVRRPLERALLIRLALAKGIGVPDEQLAADLWGDEEARIARLRVVVSRLRSTLGPFADAVTRAGGGYRVRADVFDLRRAGAAAQRVRSALRAGNPSAARDSAAEALTHWRGAALSDLRAIPFARGEGERLDAWHLELTLHRLGAELDLGADTEVVGELTELVARNPLHEPLRGMLALALYRSGRQAAALAAIAALRKELVVQLGVDPTADIAGLELRLLRHDPGLRPPAGPVALVSTRRPSATDIEPALARGLVGRRPEMAHLAGRLDEALAGAQAVVLVEGAPGMGKTRLLEAADHLVEQHGLVACWGRGSATDGTPVFWPWRQALRQWRSHTDSAVADAVIERAAGGLGRVVPEFGEPHLLAGEPATVDANDRFVLFEQVREFLTDAAAATSGLVLLLDDLHLADVASLHLLAHLTRSTAVARLLLVASVAPVDLCRDRRGAATIAELAQQPATSRIDLAGLALAAVTEQLTAIRGRPCDARLAEAVTRRTGGSPLFVQEIGRMLAADPALDDIGGVDLIPPAVRDAVRARLNALPGSSLTTLSAAAVLSSEIDAELVAAAIGQPIGAVLDHLDEAVAEGFLAPGERADRFRFAHDIVREAVRLDIALGARARMHLRVAERLEAVGDGGGAHLVAHHRLEAIPLGDRARAIRAATVAADLAMKQFAFEDAAHLYDRAIKAASTLDADTRAELLLGQARAQHLSGDVAGAMRSCEKVAALAGHRNDPALLGRAAVLLQDVGDPAWLTTTGQWCRTAVAALPPADSVLRAQVLAQLSVAATWGDQDDLDAAGAAALEMADRLDDPVALSGALRARQLARSGPDGAYDRLRFGERMVGLAPDTGDPAALWGRLWRFDAFVQLGRIDQAEIELDLLEPVVARMRQPLPAWHLIRSRAAALSARGRFAEARVAADGAVRAAAEGNHRSAEYPSHALRLSIAQLTGDPVDPVIFEVERYQPPPRLLSLMAAEWHTVHGTLVDAARIYERIPRPDVADLKPFMHLVFHSCNGTVAAALGDTRTAEQSYAQLIPYADMHVAAGAGAGFTGGSVHMALGTIAGSRGHADAAVSHLRAAAASNAAAGMPGHTAIAQHRLAVQLQRRGGPGDTEEATTAAASAAATAERLGLPLP